MPASPSSSSSVTSPKGVSPRQQNINPFSPLSPHSDPKPLASSNMSNAKHGSLITYSRPRLLKIARKCRQQGFKPPPEMSPLGAWFGVTSTSRTPHNMEDPAIASYEPPSGASSRRTAGGFGEGFGFGGGIGGAKGIGKGGRATGLRRQPDMPVDNSTNIMGRFATKPVGERNMRMGGDDLNKNQDRRYKKDDAEWRRGGPPPAPRNNDRERRPWNDRRAPVEDDAVEPAWMDDGPAQPDPAIVESNDSLVHFVPGVDMIAAHRHQQITRNPDGNQWRAEKNLVSFFGQDSAGAPIDTSSKTKSFNAANYLKQSRMVEENEEEAPEPASSSGFQSRFQRFFGAPPPQAAAAAFEEPMQQRLVPVPQQQQAKEEPQNNGKVDDHMARLMGLLSTKSSVTSPPPTAPNEYLPDSSNFSHFNQAARPPPPSQNPSYGGGPPRPMQYDVPFDHRTRQGPSHPPPPDPLQLLNQQRQPHLQGAHASLPPHLGLDSRHALQQGPQTQRSPRPPYDDSIRSPHDLLLELQQSRPPPDPRNFSPPPPQFYQNMPMPGLPPNYPPQYQHQFGPSPGAPQYDHHPGGHYQPQPQQHLPPQHAPPPPPLNSAQHDMLATLFAGLPRGSA